MQKEFNLGQATISVKIKLRDDVENTNHENLLGFATASITTDLGRLTLTGFRIWKSKFEEFKGYNVTMPMSGKFQQVYATKRLLGELQHIISEAYDDALIPVIE